MYRSFSKVVAGDVILNVPNVSKSWKVTMILSVSILRLIASAPPLVAEDEESAGIGMIIKGLFP
jgi:hypothetical protein